VDEVAEIITGNTPPKKDKSNYGDHLPLVKPGELLDGPVTEAVDYLSETGAKLARVLPPDAVLVSCIGNLGKTAIAQVPVAFNQQINAAVFSEAVVPKFGFYYLQADSVKNWMEKHASATTVTILNKGKFSRLPFPLAPINEQHRIVEKIEELFTKLDAGVRSLEQARALLKSYRHSVLKAAVEGELSRQWREAHKDELEPASELLERILQERREKFAGKKYNEPPALDISELPALPDEWTWATIEQLSRFVTDGDHNPPERVEHGIPHLTAKNVANWTLTEKNCTFVSEEDFARVRKRYEPAANDIIITCVGTVGRTAIVPENYVFSADRNLAVARLMPKGMNPTFLLFNLNTASAQRKMQSASGSTAQPHFYLRDIRAFAVALPPVAEQQAIIEEVERRLSVVDNVETTLEANLKHAEGLRKSILKQAFSGKLVPQDPDDEPASVLLERIRAERQAEKPKARKGRKSSTRPTKRDHAEQRGLF
jgi:type I restriction enzyme S subunit